MRPQIIFLIIEDRFLWSHRLPIARAALNCGLEVIIATRVVGLTDHNALTGLGYMATSNSPKARFLGPII